MNNDDYERRAWAAEAARLNDLAGRLCQAEQTSGVPHAACIECDAVRPLTTGFLGCADCGSRAVVSLDVPHNTLERP